MSKKSRRNKKKTQLPFRINILFFVVFLMFSVLILQLGVVQILNGEDFQKEIERTNQDVTKIPVPRGKIYDRNMNLIVDNEPVYSITYTPEKGVQAKDRLEVAEKLAEFITMVPEDEEDPEAYLDEKLTERNLKEYWYLLNKDEADERLSPEKREEMSNAEAYNATLDLITEEEINNFTLKEKEIIAIKKELDKAYSLTPQIVKNEGVTAEEYAKVSEHLSVLPGINATTDWNRKYPNGESLKSILGKITTQGEGIPADSEDYFLTRGYSRNDRVGTSGLEQQYESVLRGRKEQIQYTTTKNGVIVGTETVVEGQRGKDLVLTIDMDFQKEVDKIVREEFQAAKRQYANPYFNDVIAVVMNPKTGELLAVSATHYNKKENKYEDAGFRALSDAHTPGSVVKGATILAGLDSGAISPGTSFYDKPFQMKSSPVYRSYSSNLGLMNDITALKRSSNVYMFYTALRMMGEYRYPFPNGGIPKGFETEDLQNFRNYYNQLGLGVETGVDFPHESTGYKGTKPNPGLMMYQAIGQYDQYTAMQLAQYVSTIANGGYRVQPHFLKQIHDPIASQDELGPVYKSKNTEVLNKITMDDSYLNRVQEGFRQVFQEPGGTAYRYYRGVDYKPAGKTGTAETEYRDENGVKLADTTNHNLVGYAPHDDPEIAFAIIVPYTDKNMSHPTHHNIGRRILDTYFGMKDKDEDE
ncbi:peptidoglycan D,D-transpeptidase FtsI family protein [Oceanobacillus halophilus]|uniref:serine-type D-Ala-D-Ala carboxypeptidase n=1 Tax=Oceanobacillus halophilus TaxID=930130 RepID=A0A495A095_9BACI|nr:penicillin-binding protein 2 [Oceanobacillus halophilus]RKQ32690.1 penicillin-binding protein 2 [Oceanobacillus halophilus]